MRRLLRSSARREMAPGWGEGDVGPVIYEVNAPVWLDEVGRRQGAGGPVGLGDVPAEEWDRITPPGVDAVWRDIQRHREHTARERAKTRRARDDRHVRDLLSRRFLEHAGRTLPTGMYERLLDRIAAREIDAHAAATEVMDALVTRDSTR